MPPARRSGPQPALQPGRLLVGAVGRGGLLEEGRLHNEGLGAGLEPHLVVGALSPGGGSAREVLEGAAGLGGSPGRHSVARLHLAGDRVRSVRTVVCCYLGVLGIKRR